MGAREWLRPPDPGKDEAGMAAGPEKKNKSTGTHRIPRDAWGRNARASYLLVIERLGYVSNARAAWSRRKEADRLLAEVWS